MLQAPSRPLGVGHLANDERARSDLITEVVELLPPRGALALVPCCRNARAEIRRRSVRHCDASSGRPHTPRSPRDGGVPFRGRRPSRIRPSRAPRDPRHQTQAQPDPGEDSTRSGRASTGRCALPHVRRPRGLPYAAASSDSPRDRLVPGAARHACSGGRRERCATHGTTRRLRGCAPRVSCRPAALPLWRSGARPLCHPALESLSARRNRVAEPQTASQEAK